MTAEEQRELDKVMTGGIVRVARIRNLLAQAARGESTMSREEAHQYIMQIDVLTAELLAIANQYGAPPEVTGPLERVLAEQPGRVQ